MLLIHPQFSPITAIKICNFFKVTVYHAPTLEFLIIFYVWIGQGVTRMGKSMFSISLVVAVCVSQSEAVVYRCL
jgi:hypothetical protein